MKKIIFVIMLIPMFFYGQYSQITGINPSQGVQGNTVPLIISGVNFSFSGFSCWSGTGNLSPFKFTQWSETFWGTPISDNSSSVPPFPVNELEGNVSIPPFQPVGIYDLYVWDCDLMTWKSYGNAFSVISGTSEINEEPVKKINLYPNPVSDILQLEFLNENKDHQDIQIKIINNIGKIIYLNYIASFSNSYKENIDLSSHASGVYFVEIISASEKITKKFIIK